MKKTGLILLMAVMLVWLSGCVPPDSDEQAVKVPITNDVPAPEANPANPVVPEASTTVPDKAPTAPAEGTAHEQADSTTSPTLSWYFIRNDQHQMPGTNAEYKELLAQHQAFYILPNDRQNIYLTFDCGYELGYTSQILDTLAAQNVKAAFFITGQYIKTQPDLVRRMHEEGHLVCNHSFNHPDFSTISQSKLEQEITSLESLYRDLTGQDMDKYLRPPMGNFNANSLQWTKALGYSSVFWSMAWKDWDPQQQPGADYVYQHVIDNIHPGAVILMHAVSESDTQALEKTITTLLSQGYVFSTFDS